MPEGSIMQQVNTLVVETILLPPEKKNEVNVARALKLIKIALSNVNSRLSDREYLAGKFSGADIYDWPCMLWGQEMLVLTYQNLCIFKII